MIGGIPCEACAFNPLLWRDGRHRPLLPKAHLRHQRFCAGRALRGPLAHCLCLWHILLFRCGLCGLCRAVWLEVRHGRNLGGHWQRRDWQLACLVGARPAHARGHAATQGLDHARVLRQALQEQGAAHCLRCHHLRLPHPLYRLGLQWPVTSVHDGVWRALRVVRHRHGHRNLHIRRAGRLHGHGRQ